VARSERPQTSKRSTRLEILKRVSCARDWIEAHLTEPLALRDIARAAAMSTFHFHRCFTGVFGETPFAYTTRRRLALARRLLVTSSGSIHRIAASAGLGSRTSFNAIFRRHMGCSPTSFRRAARLRGQRRPEPRHDLPRDAAESCHRGERPRASVNGAAALPAADTPPPIGFPLSLAGPPA